jgi:hypothetical protein
MFKKYFYVSFVVVEAVVVVVEVVVVVVVVVDVSETEDRSIAAGEDGSRSSSKAIGLDDIQPSKAPLGFWVKPV